MKGLIVFSALLVAIAYAEDVRLLDLDPPEAQQIIDSKDTSLKYAPKIESNVPAVRYLGNEPHQVQEDIYLANQYHGQDGVGGYLYGYSVPDIAKTERKKPGGDLKGAYNYVNGQGQEIKVEYWDNGSGFHQVDNVPKILPKQIDDSPEVKRAKEEHARIWAQEAERNSKPIQNPYPSAKPGAYAGLGAGVGAGQQTYPATTNLGFGGQQGGAQKGYGGGHQGGFGSGGSGFGGNQGSGGFGQGGSHGGSGQGFGGSQGGFGGQSGSSGFGGSSGGFGGQGGSHGQGGFGGQGGSHSQGGFGGQGGSGQGGFGGQSGSGGFGGSNQGGFGGSKPSYGQQGGFGGGQAGNKPQGGFGLAGQSGSGSFGGSKPTYGSSQGFGSGQYGGGGHQGGFGSSKPGFGGSSSSPNHIDYTGQYSENSQSYATNPQNKDEEEEKGPPKGFFYNVDYPVGIIVSKGGPAKRESLSNVYNQNKQLFEQQLKGGAAVHGAGSYPNYQVHA